MRARSLPVVLRKDENASAAALMASSVSSLVNSGHDPIISPFAGSELKSAEVRSSSLCGVPVTSNILPDLEPIHWPLT